MMLQIVVPTLLFLLLSTNTGLIAQTYLPHSISFYTQSQLDSFLVYFPEVTFVGGNVHIEAPVNMPIDHPEQIRDLSNLHQLERIGGTLYIFYTEQLTDLSGLENIDSIGGGVYVEGNQRLKNMYALDNMQYGGDFETTLRRINDNDSLVHATGFQNMGSVEYLEIKNNPFLEYLPDLSNLFSISSLNIHHCGIYNLSGFSGNLQIRSIAMLNNHRMISTNGIGDSVHIRSIWIDNSPDLIDATDLGKLRSCGEFSNTLWNECSRGVRVNLSNNPSLIHLPYFTGLDTLKEFEISNCDGLTEFDDLNLNRIDQFWIRDNDGLQVLDVPDLPSIGAIVIEDNDSLLHIGPFEAVTSRTEISIRRNKSLYSIDAFHSIVDSFGAVSVTESPELFSIHLLSQAKGTKPRHLDPLAGNMSDYFGNKGEGITIGNYYIGSIPRWDLRKLKILEGFDSLRTTTNIGIIGTGLENISSFNRVERLYAYILPGENLLRGGSVGILYDSLLTDIDGIQHLRVLERQFYLNRADTLAHLNILPELDTIGIGDSTLNFFRLTYNRNLEHCELCDRLPYFSSQVLVNSNSKLQDFNLLGAASLTATLPNVTIRINPQLQQIGGFPGPFKIKGLGLRELPALTDASGLCIAAQESNGSYVANWSFIDMPTPFNSYDNLLAYCGPVVPTKEPEPLRYGKILQNPFVARTALLVEQLTLLPGGQVELFRADGSLLYRRNLTTTHTEFDLEGHPAGLYILRVRYGNGWMENFRLVKL